MLKKGGLVLITKKAGHSMIAKKGGMTHTKSVAEKTFDNHYKQKSPLEK
jgi:hypothetical protein